MKLSQCKKAVGSIPILDPLCAICLTDEDKRSVGVRADVWWMRGDKRRADESELFQYSWICTRPLMLSTCGNKLLFSGSIDHWRGYTASACMGVTWRVFCSPQKYEDETEKRQKCWYKQRTKREKWTFCVSIIFFPPRSHLSLFEEPDCCQVAVIET